jgi:acetyltransferase-like isoleucine patch superfamily enzyme
MIHFIRKMKFVIGSRLAMQSRLSRCSKYLNQDRIQVGARVTVGDGCVLYPIAGEGTQTFDSSIQIGDDVYIGHYTQLHCLGKMTIGTGSVISDYVYISDASHGLLPTEGLIMKQPLSTKGPVEIGEHCFVGYGATVMPGVRLGKHSIVSARAVVTKSVPPYCTVAGNPARVIRVFDFERRQWVAPAGDASC